jgi:colanic acid biosynthesis glycosyl transferase WcaI
LYYFPEKIGIGAFNHEMACFFIQRGYEVTVVTAFPWYPSWKVAQEYRGRLFSTENINGITVKRSFVWPPRRVNALSRMVHEAIFVVTSFFNLFSLLSKKVDVLITVCPPLGIGLPALIFSRLKKVPMIFHVQDLQVDAASDMKILKAGALLKLLSKIERCLLRSSTYVSTISEGMKERISAKGVEEGRIFLFPNWADIDFIRPLPKDNGFKQRAGLSSDSFVVLYAGNVGNKQGLEIIADVALMSRGEDKIHYLIAGDGAGYPALKDIIASKNLKNVHLSPLVPKEELPFMLASADVSLIIQKKSVGDFLMPSKLLNIMASSRPVVASVNSACSLAGLIARANCGIVVEAESAGLLYEAIIRLYKDRALGEFFGQNGRRYVEENFSSQKILGSLDRFLADITHKTRAGIQSC